MATTIKIKHKSSDSAPGTLRQGELAYAIAATQTPASSATNGNGGDKLVIGAGIEVAGVTNEIHVIGGKYFTDMMDHVRGTLTADSAVLVNTAKEVDELNIGNFFFNDNTLRIKNASAAGVGVTGATDINLNLTTLRDGIIKYVPTVDGEAPGSSYEARLVALNDANAIPNKKYVDDAVLSVITGSTTLNINAFDDAADVAIPTYAGQGSVSLGSETLNFVAGTGLNVTIDDPEFGDLVNFTDVTLTINADVATADVDAASSTLGVASFDSVNFTVTAGWVESNKFTLGTTDVNLGNTGASAISSIAGLTDITAGNIKISGDLIESVNSADDANITITAKGTAGLVKIGTLDINKTGTIAANTDSNINIKPGATGVVNVANSAGNPARITNVADPTADYDAANRKYVDSVAQGLTIRPAARAATTSNLDASYANGVVVGRPGVGATLTANTLVTLPVIDGVADGAGIPGATPPQTDRPWAVGDLILVRSQSNQAHNGLYEVTVVGVDGVTAWVLTRHEYVDDQYEIPSSYVFVQEGTTLAGTGWSALVEDFNAFDVGTDDIFWYQFSGAGSVNAGNGITVSGTTVSVRLNPIENSGLEFDGSGNLVIDVVPVSHGGTGRTLVPKNALVFGTTTIEGITATLGSSTAVVTVADTTGLVAGQKLIKTAGAGSFGPEATILSVDGPTQFTASVNHSVIGNITFNATSDALVATQSPGNTDATTGDWNSSNQIPTYDGLIVRWTNTIYGGTW